MYLPDPVQKARRTSLPKLPKRDSIPLRCRPLLALLLSGLLAACTATTPAPEGSGSTDTSVPAAQQTPTATHEPRQQQRSIQALLQLAERALNQDRLRVPEGDNAYDWYQQVLALDELNPAAHEGMQRITQRYLALAEEAFKAGDRTRAEDLLFGAQQVAASPAQAEALHQRYPERKTHNSFDLSHTDLNARSEALHRQLAEIGQMAREQSSRLLIIARSDAEGRWIYQQMREAVDGYRLRGNIKIGHAARVVLIDL